MSGSFSSRTSFKNYGRIDPHVQYIHDSQAKARRKRLIIIVASSFLLLAATICLAVGLVHARNKKSDDSASDSGGFASGSKAIQAACNSTLYPRTCEQDLTSYPGSLTANPRELVVIGIKAALAHVQDGFILARNLSSEVGNGMENAALQDCIELLDGSSDYLNKSISQLSKLNLDSLKEQFADIKIQLSTSLSYLDACADGFVNETGSITGLMVSKNQAVSESVTNTLYLVNVISKLGKNASSLTGTLPKTHFRRRRLLWNDINTNMPSWISAPDRKLLEADSTSSVSYDVIVAQDGSGKYKKIQEAVDEAPKKTDKRYVILIKAGIYEEYVTISKNYWNIMFLGEGANKTIITGNRSVALHGYTTFRSATGAISAKGFIAKGITFRNTVGPLGHQAVALRAGADLVIFQSCIFDGYQDTLYALSSRQFYKGCKIYGTVDFIFGNAAAVFQDCELVARQPIQGQQTTYTAQGRKVEVDPTGFSFQNCTLIEANDLKNSPYPVDSYLGRPWKQYSRTVFMKSYLDGFINPAGWLAWNQSNPFIDTLYYGEYMNRGPGSDTGERVNWPGVHSSMSSDEAQALSVKNLFFETLWLSDASVEFEKDV